MSLKPIPSPFKSLPSKLGDSSATGIASVNSKSQTILGMAKRFLGAASAVIALGYLESREGEMEF